MPRPYKRRRICEEPSIKCFGPLKLAKDQSEDWIEDRINDQSKEKLKNQAQKVYMTVDEYETIRLIDYEGMNQEKCASQMNVARTTVQAIYGNARAKLSDCLVNGKELEIRGGDYEYCNGNADLCKRLCRYHDSMDIQLKRMEDIDMRIAVTYEDGKIFQHFGHTEFFKIYDTEDGKIVSSKVVDSNGSGHGALAGVLYQLQVDALICGGIGGGARNALASVGIQIYGGVSGDADAAAEALAQGALTYDPNAKCSHHGEGHAHGEGHSCGGHDHGEGHVCGSHGCGGGHHCG